MPQPLIVLVVCVMLTAFCVAAVPQADFYVAADGNDQWSGKLAARNADGTDGPFASMDRALRAVSEVRAAQPARKTPVAIAVRGGVHKISSTIQITPEHSGTADSPTVITAFGDQTPVISGGVRITGWKIDGNGRWTAALPEVAAGKWNFIQLFVDGQRRYRARLPKVGYFTIADAMQPTEKFAGKGYDRFKFAGTDIRPDWSNLNDVEVLATHVWTMSRFRIAEVNAAERIVRFTGATRHLQPWNSLPKGNRYLVENVKEALSQPGEWYLDRPAGTLTYIPLPGEDPSKTVVIAPAVETLLNVRGDPSAGKWVQHVVIRGLVFADANWVTPPEGNSYAQAEVNLSGAIVFNGARDCALENCAVRNVGAYAVDIASACKRIRVEGCEMTDLGGGGVKIGLTRLESNEELLTSHQIVRDNLIAHGGRMHPAAVGVWIGHSPHNTIEHNEIFDFYYTGISVGWTWGYKPSGAHHNIIASNHIHLIGQGVLSDMGGIYTLGPSPGSKLVGNVMHDIEAFGYGGWGIYYDEGTTGMVAENNLVYRTKTGGFHQHYGRENVVRNCILAFSKKDQIQRTRAEPHLSFTFERNIVYWKTGTLLGSNWSGDNYKLDYNIYWRTDGKPIDFAKNTFEQWQKKGQDVHSLIADPMFVDPDSGDFRLKEGSPAFKVGFVPFDYTKAGRLTKSAAPLKPAPPAFPTRYE